MEVTEYYFQHIYSAVQIDRTGWTERETERAMRER
jgi:hypothetical protein